MNPDREATVLPEEDGEEAPGRQDREGPQMDETQNGREQEDERKEQYWMQHFGDFRQCRGTNDNTTIRIATTNINTFPEPGSDKFSRMKEEFKNVDCLGLSELNKNWFKVPSQQSIYNRTIQWWPHQKTKTSWLHEPEWPSEFQKGGVSLTLASSAIARFGINKGEDQSGLGRWVWHTIEGHDVTKTTIIQIYRPNRNTKDNGSTYNQQQAASGEADPLKVFDEDLIQLIDRFIDERNNIIVMGDFNEQLNGKSSIEKQLSERGITDILQARYPGQAPATHKRGSNPIDAIFASETITMIRGGYDGGKDEISDHRILWADVTLDSVLGIHRGDIAKPKTKKLQATNKVRVRRFYKTLLQQVRWHKLLEKARELEQQIGDQKKMTTRQATQYEKIDDQRCRAVAYAEDECVKLPPDNSEFSAELKRALGLYTIWKLIMRKAKQKRRIHKRWIIDTKARLKIEEHIEIPDNIEEIKAKKTAAWKRYKIYKKKAPELRSEFLDLLIKQAMDRGDMRKAKDIQQIKDRERTRDVHKRIKLARGKLRGGGVRFIHKEGQDGQMRTIKDKYQMEKEIMEANENKLHSADESPVRQGELGEQITDHNYTKWEALLCGQLDLNLDTEDGTRRWLEFFHGNKPTDIDILFTTDAYIQSWRHVKEHTSCAPGPLHFATFKTMHHCRPVAELFTILARIPIKTGYVPSRWRQSIDSMLPKKENEWRPHKLRLTSLLMPDFNHNNKILGRAAMRNAELNNKLAPEQYGSRKHHSASQHALNKRLMLDILRQQRKPAVLIANDAKACYDRILHFAAFLALRRAGLPKEAIISMLEPIRTLQHKIRTAYGDSTFAYGGEEWDRDPSGICQGNGAGPAIWALVSSPLLDILRQAGHGAKLHTAIGKNFLHLSGFAFVDDADTIHTGEAGDTTETLMLGAQKEIDLWEELVRATGGGLEGDKSDFAVINFEWTGGKWKYQTKDSTNILTVNNGRGGRQRLKQLPASEARRTLGVWQAVDGNEKTQTEKMIKKSKEWSRAAARSSLTRSDVVIGLQTSLYPSLTFGMAATSLSEDQCKEVFKPIREGALPKAGYNRNIPAVVLHGPPKYGGIGIRDMYTIQGTEHIKALLDHGGQNTPTGQLLDISISGHILEVGRSGHLFAMKFREIEHVMTQTWIKDTLEYTTKYQLELETGGGTLQTWRSGDALLMDILANAEENQITKEELQAFNRCRLHLQVVTWSDICNASGDNVLREAWECRRQWSSLSQIAYTWPHQPRPDEQDIRTWQSIIHRVFRVGPRYLTTTRNMGRFYHKTRQLAPWLYNGQDESLYQRIPEGWRRWRRIHRRTRSSLYEPTDHIVHTHCRAWHLAVVTNGGQPNVTYHGHSPIGAVDYTQRHRTPMTNEAREADRVTHHGPPGSLLDAINKIPYSMKWLLEAIIPPSDNGRTIAAQMIRNTAKCVSDGSLKDLYGTSAAVSIGTEPTQGYWACNRTTGREEDQSSFRSELCGILTNIVIMNLIGDVHGVTQGTVELACDNESALWVSFGLRQINTTDGSFDLIKVIHNELKKSPFTWKYRHVKGHQDEDEAITLDEWAIGNIDADQKAEEYWDRKYGQGVRERPRPLRMPGEGWRLSRNGHPVVNDVDTTIHEYTHYSTMMTYWEHKGRISQGTHHQAAWQTYKSALKTLPRSKQQWVHKHHCGFEGTNAMLHKCKKRRTPHCPMCAEVETHRHILQCHSAQATEIYEQQERNLGSWLHATTTTEMKRALLAHLRAYRDDEPADTLEHWDSDVQQASMAQTRLGQYAFAEGILTPRWQEVQRRHIQTTGRKYDPGRWTIELTRRLWMLCREVWETRNEIVHKTVVTRQAIIIAQLDADIKEAHATGRANRFLPRMETNFFKADIQSLLKTTEYQKRTWLHNATHHITRDRQRVANSRSVQILREFFQPGSVANATTSLNTRQSHMRAPSGTRRGPPARPF